jgi:two-component sensor histidine kinase
MVSELQHRTRNLITVVQSIARQTLADAASMEGFRESFEDRLKALSRVQSLLSQRDAEPALLGMVLHMELDALGIDGDSRVTVHGPDIPLKKSAIQVLSLAVHELATNARKYGALSTSGGRLDVSWRRELNKVILEWVERGIPTGHAQARDAATQGYGRKLIEQALPYALDAKTKYVLDSDGLYCSVELPMTTPSQ